MLGKENVATDAKAVVSMALQLQETLSKAGCLQLASAANSRTSGKDGMSTAHAEMYMSNQRSMYWIVIHLNACHTSTDSSIQCLTKSLLGCCSNNAGREGSHKTQSCGKRSVRPSDAKHP